MSTEVDVVIPVYGGASRVTRAVESVLAQDVVARVRIHLVDDASPDGAAELLARLAEAHPEVSVLTHPENRGVAAARNAAIRAGSAPFVALLDQDDAWRPSKLRLQLAALEADAGLGYVLGHSAFHLEPGIARPTWARAAWFDGPQRAYLPSALVVRRAAWERVGPFDETLRAGGDDTDWFARAHRMAVPFAFLDDVVLDRFIHDRNASAGDTDGDLLRVLRRHLADRSGA
jgi:Glycosyltransferases involved in cell wall biogenesis